MYCHPYLCVLIPFALVSCSSSSYGSVGGGAGSCDVVGVGVLGGPGGGGVYLQLSWAIVCSVSASTRLAAVARRISSAKRSSSSVCAYAWSCHQSPVGGCAGGVGWATFVAGGGSYGDGGDRGGTCGVEESVDDAALRLWGVAQTGGGDFD